MGQDTGISTGVNAETSALPDEIGPALAERLASIPTPELIADRDDSESDAANCRLALRVGVTEYSDGSVAERLASNERFIRVINWELQRRGAK